MKNLINKILFLFIACFISVIVCVITYFVKNEDINDFEIYSALIFALVLWLYYLFTGKLNKWYIIPNKKINHLK